MKLTSKGRYAVMAMVDLATINQEKIPGVEYIESISFQKVVQLVKQVLK